jgi:predicted protein tyrosine phosphatase
MKLYVKNKEDAEAANNLDRPHVIVSINFPEKSEKLLANPATNKYTKEVLFLRFSDVGRLSNPLTEGAKSNPLCIPFDSKMAKQVVDLIKRNDAEHIIIHCLGGMSRSASMADAISMYYNLEKATSWYVINELVYMTMLNELIKDE